MSARTLGMERDEGKQSTQTAGPGFVGVPTHSMSPGRVCASATGNHAAPNP